MIRELALATALAALTLPALAADIYLVDKAHSEVSFQATHLGISKVRGRFTDFDAAVAVEPGKPEASSVEFTIKVASIDTGEPKRDEHLRSGDFFDAASHPTLSFKSSRIAPKGKDLYEVTGALSMRGVSKTLTLPVKVVGPIKDPWGNERMGFETSTVVNRKDFGVSWNKLLDNGGVLVSDEILVNVSLETVKKKLAAD
jgi:polyisoprenoid-binding protein YceI